jgi:glutaredoxin 3
MPAVRIYRTRFCGFCHAAEALLRKHKIDFESIDVSGDIQTRRWLRQVSGQRTVPQIFINDRSIGGYRELSELARDGRLRLELLKT